MIDVALAISSGLRMVGSVYEGFAQAKEHERLARDAERAGIERAKRVREDGIMVNSEIRALSAGGNVDLSSGSVQALLYESTFLMERDSMQVMDQARFQAAAHRRAATRSRIAGIFGGVTAGSEGALSYYSNRKLSDIGGSGTARDRTRVGIGEATSGRYKPGYPKPPGRSR